MGSIDLEFIAKIIVPVITGLFGIAIALIARKARANTSEATTTVPAKSAAEPTPPAAIPPQTDVRKMPTRGTPIQFTHSEIAAHIKRGTPFQQSLLEKDYIGATIHWRGILRSIDRYADGRASVVVDCSDDGTHVSCHGGEDGIAELRLTETGSDVEVTGVIDCISGAYTELSDCIIRPVPKEASLKTGDR